jgi:phosphoserine aminotransferase
VFYVNTEDKALNKKIEDEFVYKSRMAGFLGLGGHRHVGGLRSTVYNAVAQESADALA